MPKLSYYKKTMMTICIEITCCSIVAFRFQLYYLDSSTQTMLILVWSDGAMKLSVTCLSPFGRSLPSITLSPTVGVVLIAKLVSPLAGTAHVNSTIVPALTFLD